MSTRTLARFAAEMRFDDLPGASVERAKCHLLDGLGCLLAGTQAGPGRSAAAMVAEFGKASPQATIFTGNTQGAVRDAAFVNAMTLYSVGLNDIHKASVSHPGGCIIPVVLAMGEWQRLPGSEWIVSMLAGYEVMGRVGRSIMPSHRTRGFHPTGTFGTFGAAAAAARLLQFDPAQTANTLGIAGSQAAGLFEFHRDGALTMVFHAARAAQNGVEAALLTKAGLTGPHTVLEGARGFCRAASDVFDEAALTRELGRQFEIEATSFRPYYGCSSTIAGSGATAALVGELSIRSPDEVAAVHVHCHPVVARDNHEANPLTLLAARLSMPFNVSLVLARGDVVTADLTEADLQDARIRSSLNKVILVEDAAMPRFGCRVAIRLHDGRSAEQSMLTPGGDATNPLTWNDVVNKFQRLTASVIRPQGAGPVIAAVHELEQTDGAVLAQRLREALYDC